MGANCYDVKVIREVPNGCGNGTNRYPMATVVCAPSARVAIDRAVQQLRAEGYEGVYRWPEAVNTEDAHDALRLSW